MITVPNFESFEDQITHKTVFFDGGKLRVTATNNTNDWDCIVKLFDLNGKVVASARTYNAPKEIEVNPGIYKVTIQALASMEGIETYKEIEEVIIKAEDITPISHDFKTGNFEIFTKVADVNIDAVVTIKESNSGKSVGGTRKYLKGAKFLFNPRTYEVKTQAIGVHKGKSIQIFTIDIVQGQLTSKVVKF